MSRVVAVDQGTTGTKAFVLADDGTFTPLAAFEHQKIYPHPGWVEHDPEELLAHVTKALAAAADVDAAGIANQGETVIAWDRDSKRPIYNAIVWQDDRTQAVTDRLKADGAEALTLSRAGLPLDPYFSASKLHWIIEHVEEARTLLSQGRLRLGTSDAFFLDRLTGVFATDVTTASRTSLMNLGSFAWDDELCSLFGVPQECLPAIRSTTSDFGTRKNLPIVVNVVDQQAALFGHGCTEPGDAKITFGTGAFALAVGGPRRIHPSCTGLVPTVAWQMGLSPPVFAFDGGVYSAAAAVNWAKSLGLFSRYEEIDYFPQGSAIERGLAFVPALSGLACPHWDRRATGLWIGLGLETSRSDLLQSILEGVALRAVEVMSGMARLIRLSEVISIDGGLAHNGYLCRFLARALSRTIRVPSVADLTAFGTARLAMIGASLARPETLPPMPPAKCLIEPDSALPAEAMACFATAVERAKRWRGH